MPTLAAPPARHLADVAFRFGPPSPARGQRPQPSAGEAWALDDVLGALARGAGVFESRTGWRLRHAHRRPGLAEALPRYAEEIRAWTELALTQSAPDTALLGWSPRVRLYVEWLDAVLLPSGLELAIRPGVSIADRAAFRASVQAALEAGPGSVLAAPMRSTLSALFARYASACRARTSPARQRALAA